MAASVVAALTVVGVVFTGEVAAHTEAALEGEVPPHRGQEAVLIETAQRLPVPAHNRMQDPVTMVPVREAIPRMPLNAARHLTQHRVPLHA